MTMFTCGPVEMFKEAAIVRSLGFVHFRTSEYGQMVKDILKEISQLLGNTVENSLIYLASSGTGAMEAVIENCMTVKDKALVINGGGFGKRFCELLEYHNIPFESIDLEWNETLTAKHFEPFENSLRGGVKFTTLFVNIHETTSGQLYDIQLISDFCKRNNLYLVVDAISSFLADDYNMEKYGIDTTIISSQKGLCCSPGMALLSFSRKMINKINSNPLPVSKYFDFKDYLINIPRGQTPYTPPVLVMYEIREMLKLINKSGGKDCWINKVKEKTNYFRLKAPQLGFKIPDYPMSNMLTAVQFDDVSAYEVIQVLKDKYHLYINPCGGKLADKLVRVSHIGNTTVEDIDNLLDKLVLSANEVKERNVYAKL